MGIRDYLKEWVDPFDTLTGWKVGDIGVTTREQNFYQFIVPAGALVDITSLPEARHGGDPHGLSSYKFGEHSDCECALSEETGNMHFGFGVDVIPPASHHIWCNFQERPTRSCAQCKKLWSAYPYPQGQEDPEALLFEHFPNILKRDGTQ